jgi:hypothetical protein
VARGAPRGLIGRPRRALRWSTPPTELIPLLTARQGFVVSIRRAGVLRRARPLTLMMVPLSELHEGNLIGRPATDWFVWQSLTGIGGVTKLPTDPQRLAYRLARDAGRADRAVLRLALGQLVEALYGERVA